MPLVIVESPNKIPKIKKILGNNYTVMSSVGHIMDLDKKNMGIDLNTFTPTYKVSPGKGDVVKNLKEEAKNHEEIYIATDDDKEGECIAFNLKDILPKKGKKIERVIFRSITKADILAGLKNPVGFRQNIYDSQQARRMADRIVGFKVSPLMWTKGLRKTSAGRVQSAALKYIVDREKEIRTFVKEEYWSISGETNKNFEIQFWGLDGKKFIPKNKEEVDQILSDLQNTLTVTEYSKKTKTRSPEPPFQTTTLQKDAGTRFGWSSKKVMDVAQSLFSMGMISYHRTDSTRIEPSKITDIRDKIEKAHTKKYLSAAINTYSSQASAQDAHEAIRPTFDSIPMNLNSDEKKLYDLIKNRFMASQMADAIFDQASIKLTYKGKKTYEFRVSGSVMQFDGFLKVYGNSGNNVSLPPMKKGDLVTVKSFLPKQHFTKAPPRYTEPAFVAKMEKEGIGRPATYASVIETLVKRGYAIKENKALRGTEIGIMVCEYLENHFDKLTSSSFTSELEESMDKIANGEIELKDLLDSFYKDLISDIDKASKDKSSDLFKTEKDCPDCNNGHKLTKKIGSHGVFMGCESYPECGYTVSIGEDGELKEEHVETGKPCPDCGSKIIKRKRKDGKGDFYGCSAYPTCKWIGDLDSEGNIINKKSKAILTEHSCPNCKDGKLARRESKWGAFYGCNKYPKCKTTMDIGEDGIPIEKNAKTKKKSEAKSTGESCPKCKKGELLEREGKFGKFKGCSLFPKCKHIEK